MNIPTAWIDRSSDPTSWQLGGRACGLLCSVASVGSRMAPKKKSAAKPASTAPLATMDEERLIEEVSRRTAAVRLSSAELLAALLQDGIQVTLAQVICCFLNG